MSRISLGTFYDTIQFKQRHTHTKQSGKNNERTQNKEFQLNGEIKEEEEQQQN